MYISLSSSLFTQSLVLYIFVITAEILALSLANFSLFKCEPIHEFIIYATRHGARAEYLTICCRIISTLWLTSRETVSFISPRPSNIEVGGKQNSLFPAVPVIKCFVITPNSSEQEKTTAKKSFALRRLAHKFATVSRSTGWSRASRKFMLLFP